MREDGFSLSILDRTDSTNNYAMQKVRAGLAKHGAAVFALEQTKGKGQRGKSWQTGKGKNIALSVMLKADRIKLSGQFHLSIIVALACYDFIKKYAGDETKIKWPNDLYWCDRKAGGILIENSFRGKTWVWSVVGIGININQAKFASKLKNPVSLKQVTGKDYDIIELANELHALVFEKINAAKSKSFKKLLEEYNACLYKQNEKVKLKYKGKTMQALIKEVNQKGQLVIFSEKKEVFDFGEIEWIM